MNKDTVQGDWKVLKGKIKESWGKLTDDEIDSVEGNLDQLQGHIQKAYGLSKDEATKKYNEFKDSLKVSRPLDREEEINRTSLDSDINQPPTRDRDIHH